MEHDKGIISIADEVIDIGPLAGKNSGLFTFNGKGAYPHCKGRGMITTELVFMEPVTTICEYCNGSRYSDEELGYHYKGKTIVEVLDQKIKKKGNIYILDEPTTGLHMADTITAKYLRK